MQHVIKKQVIELQIDKSLDSFHIQQQVSNHYLQQIVPLLQIQFDTLTNEDEILILEKLEIDIGTVSAEEINNINIDNLFIKKIVRQTIAQIIREKIVGENITANTMPANSYRQWFYYMQKGYLQWSFIKPTAKWYTEVLQQLATDFNSVEGLRKEITTNKTFVKRIVQEHTATFLSQLVSIITSKNQDNLFETINEISFVLLKINNSTATLNKLNEPVENILWQNVLQLAVEGNSKTTHDISKEVFKNHIIVHKYIIDDESIKKVNESTLLKPIIKQLQQEEIFTAKNIVKQQIKKEKEISLSEEEINIKKNKKEAAMQVNEQIDEEGIFTSLAGIVLLHPFLSSLFSGLHLLENKQFINLQTQEKAIIVLYYLATGHTAAAEHELVIPKILCGFGVQETVTKNTFLSDAEMEEADGLLNAVIAQWNILKNTSIVGLRESFLQRNGKVFTKNNDIHIQIEKSSIDILLDHLPWGLNIIKLPWVNNIIRTEWR